MTEQYLAPPPTAILTRTTKTSAWAESLKIDASTLNQSFRLHLPNQLIVSSSSYQLRSSQDGVVGSAPAEGIFVSASLLIIYKSETYVEPTTTSTPINRVICPIHDTRPRCVKVWHAGYQPEASLAGVTSTSN